MWPIRPKDSPKWPTFRHATLDWDYNASRIYERLFELMKDESEFGITKVMQVSVGKQFVRESENGGFLNHGGTRRLYSVVSFELQCKARQIDGKMSFIYLIGWVGGYGKGSIMHVGWQYPHAGAFIPEELEHCALNAYCEIAKLSYGQRTMDPEVFKFISSVQGVVANG